MSTILLKAAIELDIQNTGRCLIAINYDEAGYSEEHIIAAVNELGYIYTKENSTKIRVFRNEDGKFEYEKLVESI